MLDNLRSWKLGNGGKDYANYEYNTTTNRLTRILGSAGEVRQTFTWDVQGNVNVIDAGLPQAEDYTFDYGNRNRGIVGKEGMRYDAYGRRVSTWLPQQGKARFYLYSRDGQLLYEASETQGKNISHIYLGGSLIASSEAISGGGTQVRLKHTDALGSPVVTTDMAGNEVTGTRQTYEPFGKQIGAAIDGVGYTGHVMEPQSGLVYMQQRYYDPSVGVFMSVDPVSANSANGANFNRYNYAANNPYRFTDPDGRMIQTRWRNVLGQNPFGIRDPNCQSAACRFALGGPERRFANGRKKDKGPSEHVLENPESLDGQLGLDENGDGDRNCAELIKVAFKSQGVKPTWEWQEGRRISYGTNVAVGTAIANFVDGKYPQEGVRHAAVYMGQDASGIYVMDQWDSGAGHRSYADPPDGEARVGQRLIPWTAPPDAGLSNNGSAFSTVLW